MSNGAARRYFAAWEVCRRLPLPVAIALARVGGRTLYELDGPRRRALAANLGHVLPTASAKGLEAMTRRGFASYARYWAEAFRLEIYTAADLRERLVVEGLEHVETAVARGRGAILAAPHLGNWDVGGAWLGASGYSPVALVERLRPPELFDRFVTYREALGMQLLPLDSGAETLRTLRRLVESGRLALLVSDRDPKGGRGVPVEMFGAMTTLPGGPASLALRTGAPLLPTAVFQSRRPGRWHGVCRPPVPSERTGDMRADVARVTQAFARELEGLIARDPGQWHVLERRWPAPGRAAAGFRGTPPAAASPVGQARP